MTPSRASYCLFPPARKPMSAAEYDAFYWRGELPERFDRPATKGERIGDRLEKVVFGVCWLVSLPMRFVAAIPGAVMNGWHEDDFRYFR